MFKNYLKIALRNIRNHKGYSFINIFGLAVGMACCILILLWVQDELRYDRFHENADQIYRVALGDPVLGPDKSAAVTPIPLAPAAKEKIPEVILAARLTPRRTLLQYGDNRFDENGLMVSPDFLKMFSFQFIQGNVENALKDPFSIIITKSLAEKYFGDENPLGKVFRENNIADFEVTGVIEDVPHQSHLQFDFLMAFKLLEQMRVDLNSWDDISYYSYVLLDKKSDVHAVEDKLNSCLTPHFEGRQIRCFLQPLTDIYLHSNFLFDMGEHGNAQSVVIFGVVALFVLVIACINFMNLTTARSGNRAMEVGLRKVAGAHRNSLIRQFFGESFVLTFIALILTLVFVRLYLPAFNALAGKALSMNFVISRTVLLVMGGIVLLTGLISGSYPALYLSSFRPVIVLKGSMQSSRMSATFRKTLVVTQFTITIMVLIGMALVHEQFRYLRTKDLGYDKESILTMPMRGGMRRQYETVKQELLKNPAILSITATANLPTHLQSGTLVEDWEEKNIDEDVHFKILWVDPDYMTTFKMTMTEGRFFSDEFTDDQANFIINETGVKALGLASPLGKRLSARGQNGRIIGVVKDFHYRSLHHEVEPLMLVYRPARFYTLCIRMSPDFTDLPSLIQHLEKIWDRFSPQFPFEYQFLNQRLDSLYRSERRVRDLFNIFSLLTIMIACLGLLGLASFMAEQKTKEIGIRKVLGASVPNIVILLTKAFVKWALLANLIAWPVAYFAMDKWLQGFAYRINIGLWSFILSGAIALVIAFMTVSYQSIKAAVTNPVKSLRYE